MALSHFNRILKFLLLSKLFAVKPPLHLELPISFPRIFEMNINLNPFKKLFDIQKALPFINQKQVFMKNPNVYESLVNQTLSQTKFCTKSEKKCENKTQLGRHDFHKETEQSINDQIGAEFNAAFAYLSMACYFGRTDIALPGCQAFFMDMYEEELEHAIIFVNYLLKRGAYVTLSSIDVPEQTDWKSIKDAFSTAIHMEETVKEKLVCVFDIAEKHNDLEVMDIISTQFMDEQNRSICELARHLKRAEMTDNPVGEYLFDKMIYDSYCKKSNLMYKKKIDVESEDAVYK